MHQSRLFTLFLRTVVFCSHHGISRDAPFLVIVRQFSSFDQTSRLRSAASHSLWTQAETT